MLSDHLYKLINKKTIISTILQWKYNLELPNLGFIKI